MASETQRRAAGTTRPCNRHVRQLVAVSTFCGPGDLVSLGSPTRLLPCYRRLVMLPKGTDDDNV
jgi:hypothetical protein